MSGTTAGGIKTRDKNLARDPDFYKRIGSKGGKHTGRKGFALNPALARIAGRKGGKNGRRGVSKKNITGTSDSNTDDNVIRKF